MLPRIANFGLRLPGRQTGIADLAAQHLMYCSITFYTTQFLPGEDLDDFRFVIGD